MRKRCACCSLGYLPFGGITSVLVVSACPCGRRCGDSAVSCVITKKTTLLPRDDSRPLTTPRHGHTNPSPPTLWPTDHHITLARARQRCAPALPAWALLLSAKLGDALARKQRRLALTDARSLGRAAPTGTIIARGSKLLLFAEALARALHSTNSLDASMGLGFSSTAGTPCAATASGFSSTVVFTDASSSSPLRYKRRSSRSSLAVW